MNKYPNCETEFLNITSFFYCHQYLNKVINKAASSEGKLSAQHILTLPVNDKHRNQMNTRQLPPDMQSISHSFSWFTDLRALWTNYICRPQDKDLCQDVILLQHQAAFLVLDVSPQHSAREMSPRNGHEGTKGSLLGTVPFYDKKDKDKGKQFKNPRLCSPFSSRLFY